MIAKQSDLFNRHRSLNNYSWRYPLVKFKPVLIWVAVCLSIILSSYIGVSAYFLVKSSSSTNKEEKELAIHYALVPIGKIVACYVPVRYLTTRNHLEDDEEIDVKCKDGKTYTIAIPTVL